MVIFYGIVHYRAGFSLALIDGVLLVSGLAAYIFTMLGIDFVAKRNELSKSTSYCIFLFAILTTMVPVALLVPKIMLANCAIILATRRIISLRSERDIQQKILDASLWIMLASIFYFWSILFFGVLFLGIGLYVGQNYRNWLIPFVGVLASYVVLTCISLMVWDRFFSFTSYMADFSIFFVVLCCSETFDLFQYVEKQWQVREQCSPPGFLISLFSPPSITVLSRGELADVRAKDLVQ